MHVLLLTVDYNSKKKRKISLALFFWKLKNIELAKMKIKKMVAWFYIEIYLNIVSKIKLFIMINCESYYFFFMMWWERKNNKKRRVFLYGLLFLKNQSFIYIRLIVCKDIICVCSICVHFTTGCLRWNGGHFKKPC